MGIWNTVQKWQGKSVPPCSMIVAAAGSSCRMGGQDKLFAPLAGVPVLTRTLRAIDRAELVSEIVVAAQEERMEAVADLCAAAALHKKVKVVKGGASRTESVLAAALECDPRAELIAIHDGARPLVRPEMIDEMIRAGWQTQAAAPSTPVTDTVKVADDDRWVASTPDRSTLYAVQTPQVFQANILKAALQAALASGEPVTDDCAAVERLGKRVWLAGGGRRGEYQDHHASGSDNRGSAAAAAGGRTMTALRIGHGYDVHRLVEGRALILGGVTIPWERGLDGHSDADVLTHAVMDALLGAIAAGDIGKLFPDNDAAFHNISSMLLLKRVGEYLRQEGYTVVNIDATLIAQAPKVSPYRDAMRQNIAAALGVDVSQISVKATTEEHLGFTGTGEGMAAHAVALVEKL